VRKRRIYAIQIILSLVIVIGLATGCALPPSTSTPSSAPTPPASTYPADMSGHVTIADKVIVEHPKSHKKLELTAFLPDRNVWWIVDVSVKNKDYENPITSIWDSSISMPVGQEHRIWSIMIDGKLWSGLENLDIFTPPSMRLLKGQSGKTTFTFEVPINTSPSDVQICYRGQEPYSFGKLSGGKKVALYDWDLKKAVEETGETTPTPTVIQVTIQELNRAYMGNELAADAKYKDKILRVTGVVAVIQRNSDDTLGMTLTSTRFSTDPVYFSFDKKYEPELGQLTIGQSVTVQGRCIGDFFGVHFKDCVLVR